MQELRLRAAGTACARTQVTWLRDRLLKLGAHVVASVRRIVLHLPTATPTSTRGGTSPSRSAPAQASAHVRTALTRHRASRDRPRRSCPAGRSQRAIRPIFRPTWPALDSGNVRSFVRDTITPSWEPKSESSSAWASSVVDSLVEKASNCRACARASSLSPSLLTTPVSVVASRRCGSTGKS